MPKTPDTAADVLAEVACEALPATDPAPVESLITSPTDPRTLPLVRLTTPAAAPVVPALAAAGSFAAVAETAGAAAQATRPDATRLHRLIVDGVEIPFEVARVAVGCVTATLGEFVVRGADEREAIATLQRKVSKGHQACAVRRPGEPT